MRVLTETIENLALGRAGFRTKQYLFGYIRGRRPRAHGEHLLRRVRATQRLGSQRSRGPAMGCLPLGMMASTREGDPMEEQLAATAADEAAEPVVATVSPLVRIREKEVEISGRILAARSEAEQIMGDARRAAADIIHQAETEAEELSKGVVQDSLARGDVEANRIREEAEAKVASLETRLAERRDAAVDLIVSTVTSAQS